MSHADQLLTWLRVVRQRGFLLALQDRFGRFLFWASLALAGAVAAGKVVPLPVTIPGLAGLLSLAAAAGALAITLARRGSLLDAAIYADRTLGTQDRIGSAYAVLCSPGAKVPAAVALFRDAARQMERFSPAVVWPYRRPRHLRKLAAAILVTGLIYALPSLPIGRKKPPAAAGRLKTYDSIPVRRAAEARTEAGTVPREPPDLDRDMKALGDRLDRGEIGHKDALKDLSRLEDQIRRSREQLAPADLERALRVLRQSADGLPPKSGNDARRAPASERVKEIMARSKTGRLGPQDRQELRKALAQLRQDIKGLEGAAALSRALDDALQASELSGTALAEVARQMEQLETMDRALDKLRKLDAEAKARKQALCQVCDADGYCDNAIHAPGREAGRGSTNRVTEGYKTKPAGALARQSDLEKPMLSGKYERLYDAQRLNQSGYDSRLQGKPSGQGTTSYIYLRTAPNAEMALTPYAEAYARQAAGAEDPVAKGRVPPQYRQYVKNYFEAIKPEKPR